MNFAFTILVEQLGHFSKISVKFECENIEKLDKNFSHQFWCGDPNFCPRRNRVKGIFYRQIVPDGAM